MLINNVKKHKEKYSQRKRNKSTQTGSIAHPQSIAHRTIFNANNTYSCTKMSLQNLKEQHNSRQSHIQQQMMYKIDSKVQFYKKVLTKNDYKSRQSWDKTIRQNNLNTEDDYHNHSRSTNQKQKTLKRISRNTAQDFLGLGSEIKKNLRDKIDVYQEEKVNKAGLKRYPKPFFMEKNRNYDSVKNELMIAKKRQASGEIQNKAQIMKRLQKDQPMKESKSIFSNKKSINLQQYFQSQATLAQKQEQKFMSEIKFHEVFFCCCCLKYIFAIQKKLHSPECTNIINFATLQDADKQKLKAERLDLVKQLSIYTNTKVKEVEALTSKNEKGYKNQRLTSSQRNYLKLSQIEEAVLLICEKFSNKNQQNQHSQIFCTMPNMR